MATNFIQRLFKKRKNNGTPEEENGLETNNQKQARNAQMKTKKSPPSIKKTAFDCPHCGAYTTQFWFEVYAKQLQDEEPLPYIPEENFKDIIQRDEKIPQKQKEQLFHWHNKIIAGLPFLADESKSPWSKAIYNLRISKCYHCKKIAVWISDNMVFPSEKQGVLPNQDLPEDVIKDFEEARTIVGLSPRGAAALLRLCIQKLCAFLGEKGINLDKDIASLVEKGLNPLVQQSLDIVRVIGNEAVHPGVIDLNDDRDTANQLFDLINSIADQMITHPNNIKKLYEQLPEGKRKAIEERDERKD